MDPWRTRAKGAKVKDFRFADWMSMARGANLPTVWSNVLAAWAINAGTGPSFRWMPEWTDLGFFSWSILIYLIIGSSLLYAGGCFLNDAKDHTFDREYRPERPIPSGKLTIGQAWACGTLQLLAGAFILIWGAGCSAKWTTGLVVCVVAYDLLHKKSAWTILLMGGCRTLLWLTAGTCASGMAPAPLLYFWAIASGFYVIGISWYARSESGANHAGPMPQIQEKCSILFLFIIPMLALAFLVLWNNLDPIRTFLANLAGLLAGMVVFFSVIQMRDKEKGAINQGVSRLLAGICCTDATALAFHAPILVGPCILLGAFAHFMQKKFAAT